MLGGVLQIVGLVALLHWSCKLLVTWLDRRAARAAWADGVERRRMYELSGGDAACPWPARSQHEPEVERLRRRAAL